MDGIEKLCEEKHKSINEKLERQNNWLDEHEKKIDNLERSNAENTVEIKHLTKAIGNQTKAIWGLVSTILATLLGFFVWFVQSLAR